MQEYDKITTLPFSKSCPPVFAQRKPKGELGLLIYLKSINPLVKHDSKEHNQPVTTPPM